MGYTGNDNSGIEMENVTINNNFYNIMNPGPVGAWGSVLNRDALHESVGVGHYDSQGNVKVDYAWSFGGDGTYFHYFVPEKTWLGFPFPVSVEGIGGPHGLYDPEGEIYATDGFGTVIASKAVTIAQALHWLKYMNGRNHLKDIYGADDLNCITYSGLEYAYAPGGI